MAWIEKAQSTPFDSIPIHGLFFLDGDTLARFLHLNWTEGMKMPMMALPSGEERELWESSDPERGGIVHLFGEMDLPLLSTRDDALRSAYEIAEALGYTVIPQGDDGLEVIGYDEDDHLMLRYDQTAHRLADIIPIHSKPEERPQQPLVDEASRARLPKIGTKEHLGLNALAQIKFFTPDAGWTWWASEASALLDDDTYVGLQEISADDPRIASIIFFGLVDGFELEFGYFTLEELKEIRGPLGLPIERDRFFEPTSLGTLLEKHKQGGAGD